MEEDIKKAAWLTKLKSNWSFVSTETLATSQAVEQQPHSFMHWQFGTYMPILRLKACVL